MAGEKKGTLDEAGEKQEEGLNLSRRQIRRRPEYPQGTSKAV
jgi:hypothetical protein